jgi:hypothetical protein
MKSLLLGQMNPKVRQVAAELKNQCFLKFLGQGKKHRFELGQHQNLFNLLFSGISPEERLPFLMAFNALGKQPLYLAID